MEHRYNKARQRAERAVAVGKLIGAQSIPIRFLTAAILLSTAASFGDESTYGQPQYRQAANRVMDRALSACARSRAAGSLPEREMTAVEGRLTGALRKSRCDLGPR